jgi:hypothetical protein
MSLFTYIRDLDKKFSWSFTGVVIAIIFGGVTIYTQFYADAFPRLQYDILTSTPVLDVHEEVGKLSILFDGIDIRQQQLSLQVLTIRVINDSSKNILKSYYDENDPLGLHISSGKIIKTDLLAASSDYLKKQVVFRQQNDQTLLFPSVILEGGEFFVIKLLILHSKQSDPSVSAIGKIAGIHSISIREPYKHDSTSSFLGKTYNGSLLVQMTRLITYFFGMIIFLIVVIAPIAIIGGKINERKKHKLIKEFKTNTSVQLNDSDEFIFDMFLHDKEELILPMLNLFSDAQAIKDVYSRYKEYKTQKKHIEPIIFSMGTHEMFYHESIAGFPIWLREPFEAGLIQKTEHGIVVDEHIKTTLQHFVKFLQRKGVLSGRNLSEELNSGRN